MIPIADFSGHFGWGFDGVNLFAPTHLYGQPDDLRHLLTMLMHLDSCHLRYCLQSFGSRWELYRSFLP